MSLAIVKQQLPQIHNILSYNMSKCLNLATTQLNILPTLAIRTLPNTAPSIYRDTNRTINCPPRSNLSLSREKKTEQNISSIRRLGCLQSAERAYQQRSAIYGRAASCHPNHRRPPAPSGFNRLIGIFLFFEMGQMLV